MMLGKYFSSIQQKPETEAEDATKNLENTLIGEEGEETEENDIVNDPMLEYDLGKLKLHRLMLMEKQLLVKQKLLIQQNRINNNNCVTNRRVLGNGRSSQFVTDDTSLTVGAGDSCNIPDLQRDGSRSCVSCGARAGLFCAGCHVTPYCGVICQRKDWELRHNNVCHNLARCSGKAFEQIDDDEMVVAGLRRPRSIHNGDSGAERTVQRMVCILPAEVNSADTQQRNSYEANSANVEPWRNQQPQTNHDAEPRRNQEPHTNRNAEPRRNQNPQPNRVAESRRNQNPQTNRVAEPRRNQEPQTNRNAEPRRNQEPQTSRVAEPRHKLEPRGNHELNRGQEPERTQGRSGYQQRPQIQNKSGSGLQHGNRSQDEQEQPRPLRQPRLKEADTKPAATDPVEATKPVPVAATKPVPVAATKPGPVAATKIIAAKEVSIPVGTVTSATPRKPLIPSSCMIQKLSVGDVFVARVTALATERASAQAGFVCLTLHQEYECIYNQLIADFAELCDADKQEYLPRIGETFAYYRQDEGWYRARCLSPTRAALLDEGNIVSLEQSVCRKLPSSFASVPEFVAVIKMDGLNDSCSLHCTITGVSSHAVTVTVTEDSGAELGEAEAERWATIVEYPSQDEAIPAKVEAKLESIRNEPPTITTPKPVENIPEPKVSEPEIVSPVLNNPGPDKKPDVARPEQRRKPIVPDSYLIDKLSVGDSFVASVTSYDENDKAFLCETAHVNYAEDYNRLCVDFIADCGEKRAHYTPSIGETFAYLDEEGWFRARCLSHTRAALVDAGRVVPFEPSVSRKLPRGYENVPEFLAVIEFDSLQVGDQLDCHVVSTGPCAKVRVGNLGGPDLGEGRVRRWLPKIEYPDENTTTAVTPAAAIPTLDRPMLEHNATYVLLDVTSLSRACVRPADAESQEAFHAVVHDTLTYALTAKPLTEPPQRGQTVISKFVDGNFYRAFVKRTNLAKNKYMIEYVEYGNDEVVPLERLYPCPGKLSLPARPPIASFVRLSERDGAITAPAAAFIDRLKDSAVELILTIPGGTKQVPSGSLGNLVVAKNCELVSRKIEELCTPAWRRLLERGGDVLETESRSFGDLPASALPTGRPLSLVIPYCAAETLATGTLNAHRAHDAGADRVFGELALQINEYAESALCKDPYMPKLEELCIVKHKKDNKWARAVLGALPDGAGSQTADVIFLDYGNIDTVPTSGIRKLMPEFVDDYPVATNHLEIKDFPKQPSRGQLERALRYLRQTAGLSGELTAVVTQIDDGMYEVDAPDLIQALA